MTNQPAEEYFNCAYCKKRHLIAEKTEGYAFMARKYEEGSAIWNALANMEFYKVQTEAFVLPICNGCIKQHTMQHYLIVAGLVVGGGIFFLLDEPLGMKRWGMIIGGFLASFGILGLVKISAKREDIVDSIVVKLVWKTIPLNMARKYNIKLLSRKDNSDMVRIP